MLHCPKCGGHEIFGPFYEPADYPMPDALLYRCRCGYSTREPTRDRKREDKPATVRVEE